PPGLERESGGRERRPSAKTLRWFAVPFGAIARNDHAKTRVSGKPRAIQPLRSVRVDDVVSTGEEPTDERQRRVGRPAPFTLWNSARMGRITGQPYPICRLYRTRSSATSAEDRRYYSGS